MSSHRKEHHEEHMDETWLIPYSDLLTLLLALFIVLFASSQIDSKKLQQLAQSFSMAFSGGSGVLDQYAATPLSDDPTTTSKKKTGTAENQNPNASVPAESSKAKERNDQWQLGYEQETKELEQLRQKLDVYIRENGLTSQLETQLTPDRLMITIRDNALFASGSAEVKPEARKLATSIADMLTQYPQYEVIVAGHTDNVPIRSKAYESNWDLSSARALNFMKILFQNERLGQERFSSVGFGEFRPITTNDTAEGRAKNRRVEVSIMRKFKELSEQQTSAAGN